MPAANVRDGEVKDDYLAWRTRSPFGVADGSRRGTTTGKVHVVRISKRVVPQSDPLVDRTSAIARR